MCDAKRPKWIRVQLSEHFDKSITKKVKRIAASYAKSAPLEWWNKTAKKLPRLLQAAIILQCIPLPVATWTAPLLENGTTLDCEMYVNICF